MNKTIPIAGLHILLAKLQPYLKAIVSESKVKLSDAADLNVPDGTTIAISDTGDPETFNIGFGDTTVTVHTRVLFGMVPINGQEPLKSIMVSAETVQAVIARVGISLVDG